MKPCMKPCRKCGVVKPLEDFYKMTGMRDGYRHDCKACNLAAKRQKYLADPAVVKARVKRWQQANPERLNAYRRARRMEPEVRERERAGHLKRKYGMTIEEYGVMLDAQGGGCFICGRPPRDDSSLHVDHDHSSGRVRGILCFSCNNALADFQDDPALLRKAASYVTTNSVEVEEEIQLARRRALSLVGRGS
jgi:hypothetical protein